ncbi:MAG TPA: polymer-forming cytoskeletal protein [Anaeromyxobacter sp.]
MAFWNKLERPEGGPAADPLPQAPPQPQLAQHPPQSEPQPPTREKKEERTPMAMKREDVTTSPSSNGDLLLGEGAEFEGKLTFAGTVRIDAKFKGSIFTNDVLVVGEHAKIDADITCGTVIVYGEVNGNIKAKAAVELHHPAKLRGNVESPSLAIDKGVVFQGESKMGPAEKGSSVRAVPSASASASASAPL